MCGILRHIVLGNNGQKTKRLSTWIPQVLQSGDQWTSFRNSLLNFLILTYLILSTKNPNASTAQLVQSFKSGEFKGLFEGDDGICVFDGDLKLLDSKIKDLGINLKLELHSNYTQASFCGIKKCQRASDTIITDPLKYIAEIFVVKKQNLQRKDGFKLGIIRAKALSGLYQYPDMPIVSPLCSAILKRTASYMPQYSLDSYERSAQMKAAKSVLDNKHHLLTVQQVIDRIDSDVRVHVERQYGFDISYQLLFEECCIRWAMGEEVCFPHHHRMDKYRENWYLNQDGPREFCRVWKSNLPNPFLLKKEVWYHPASGTYKNPKLTHFNLHYVGT